MLAQNGPQKSWAEDVNILWSKNGEPGMLISSCFLWKGWLSLSLSLRIIHQHQLREMSTTVSWRPAVAIPNLLVPHKAAQNCSYCQRKMSRTEDSRQAPRYVLWDIHKDIGHKWKGNSSSCWTAGCTKTEKKAALTSVAAAEFNTLFWPIHVAISKL